MKLLVYSNRIVLYQTAAFINIRPKYKFVSFTKCCKMYFTSNISYISLLQAYCIFVLLHFRISRMNIRNRHVVDFYTFLP